MEIEEKQSVYWWIMNKYGIKKGSSYRSPVITIIKCATLIHEYCDNQSKELERLKGENEELRKANSNLAHTNSVLEESNVALRNMNTSLGGTQRRTARECSKLKEQLKECEGGNDRLSNYEQDLKNAQ